MPASATPSVRKSPLLYRLKCNPFFRFLLPAFEDPDEAVQMSLIKDAAARHGIRAKLSGGEIYREGLSQAPRFLLNMESYPKVRAERTERSLMTKLTTKCWSQLLAGQGVTLESFVTPVGDPEMKLEWFLNKEPLLFKSSFTPVYDYGFVGLSINKVYPDDFGELSVVVSNRAGVAQMTAWLGEFPQGEDPAGQEEPDLPAWCNKVEKGRLAVECPPEITKHLMDIEVRNLTPTSHLSPLTFPHLPAR